MKKMLLLCMIFTLILSLASPAFAAVQGASTKIDVLCNLPEIRVTIPATGQNYLLNPFQIPVEVDGAMTGQQIISTPAAIKNESLVPLSVNATVTGTVKKGSDMRLMNESVADLDTNRKYAFIYFEMQASNSQTPAAWDTEFDEDKHILIRDGRTVTRKDMITLDQAGMPNNFGVYRITGDCIAEPRDSWNENDGLNVEVAFTFTPLMRVNS